MKTIPTVAIKTKEGERLVINESDFDINRHQLWVDAEIQSVEETKDEPSKNKEPERKEDETEDKSPQKTRGAKRQAVSETK